MNLDFPLAIQAVEAVKKIDKLACKIACISIAVGDGSQAALRSEVCSKDDLYTIAYASGLLNGMATAFGIDVEAFVDALAEPDHTKTFNKTTTAIANLAIKVHARREAP